MPLAHETAIRVFENNDAVVTLRLRLRKADGTYEDYPYDSAAGDTFEFYAKGSKSDTDAEAFASYTQAAGAITVDESSGTEVTVQMTAADLDSPGEYRYHLDILQGGTLRQTVAAGKLLVEDI